MPKGPKGEKRPGDVIGAAVAVAKIATGEIEDILPTNRSKSGKAGGKARASKLTEKERRDIARKAAESRWRKHPTKEEQTKNE